MNHVLLGLDVSLERIGLHEYTHLLREEGFDTWEQLLDITEDDLKGLGVKLGHRRRLQRAIADAKAARQNEFTPASDHDYHQQTGHTLPRDSRDQQSGSYERTTPAQVNAVPQKRRYRRHPKPDQNAPKKPPSGYVIFSNQIRERIKDEDLDFSNIAKYVGDQWQDPPHPQDRTDCEQQAQSLKEAYYAELAEYKKTAEYQAYQSYLRDFRTKQDEKNAKEDKPPMTSPDASAPSGSRRRGQRYVDGGSPLPDPASIPEASLSNQSSRTDSHSFDESNVSTDTQTRWSSQSPLYHRPLSGHENDSTRQATQHDSSTLRIHHWSRDTFPRRDQDGDLHMTPAGEHYGPRGEGHSTPVSPLTTTALGHRTLPSLHDYAGNPHARHDSENDTKHMPPPVSPIDQRNRLLPPPPGLGFKHFGVDPLHPSRGHQESSHLPWRKGAQEEYHLSLPPIRTAPEERDGEQH